jgi:hypothetical protein
VPVIPPATWSELVGGMGTGDVVLFSKSDELISTVLKDVTDSPYSHVAMVVRTDPNGPPMIWQAAPQSLVPDPDLHDETHPGAQLGDAFEVMSLVVSSTYSLTPYYRSLSVARGPDFESAVAAVVEQLDGIPFPTMAGMLGHAAEGRFFGKDSGPSDMFCAQLVAKTMQMAGLLGDEHPANWYNQACFGSRGIYADECAFLRGATWNGPEQQIAVPLG